jgi:FAD/FMN-containing dehydrogenase
MNRHPLYNSLASIVGKRYVSDEEFINYSYSMDSSPMPKKIPGIIVRPADTEEVSEILKLANNTKTPVIPRGGGASIKGVPPGIPGISIIMDLTRMNRIIEINEKNMTVTAECGITVSELDSKVKNKGYIVNTVFMPFYSDSLGGLLSGVVGGGWPMDCESIGTNWKYLLGLKVVLPNGDVVETGTGPGTNMYAKKTFLREVIGPDLTGMFVSDGGILGIKTEATLQIFTPPKLTESRSYLFSSLEDVFESLYKLTRLNPYPYATLYMLSPGGLSLILGDEESSWGLVYSVHGDDGEEVNMKLNRIENIFRDNKGKPGSDKLNEYTIPLCINGKMIRDMGNFVSFGMWCWFETVHPWEGGFEYFKKAYELPDKYKDDYEKYGFKRFDWILPYQSNAIFVGIEYFFNDTIPGARERAIELYKEYEEWGVKQGAILVAVQGFETEIMIRSFSPTYFSLLKSIKGALDPNNILNPGLLI